jgi:hypothetical protein
MADRRRALGGVELTMTGSTGPVGSGTSPAGGGKSPARRSVVVKKPSQETDQRGSLPLREFRVGIDFGTAWSKLVLRDYGNVDGALSLVVRPPASGRRRPDYRVPSTVCLSGRTLWFGDEAELHAADVGARVYRSIKMLFARPEELVFKIAKLPAGLDAEGLAVLMVWYLCQRARSSAARYLERLGVSAEPNLSYTIGAPMAETDDTGMRQRYVRLLWIVRWLMEKVPQDLSSGLSLRDARNFLNRARASVVVPAALDDERDYLRSEAESGLMWAFRSPGVSAGIYALVDVGAGTTSASWFAIVNSAVPVGGRGSRVAMLVKDHLSFYCASCSAPGGDAIDKVFMDSAAVPLSLDEVRADEARLLLRAKGEVRERIDAGLTPVLEGIADVYGEAGVAGGRARRLPATREVRSGKVFFFGGGSRLPPVRESILARQRKWPGVALEVMPDECPTDLYEIDGAPVKDDATFLLVAYGLAHRMTEVPDAFSPSAVPPVEPLVSSGRRPSHEELYGR